MQRRSLFRMILGLAALSPLCTLDAAEAAEPYDVSGPFVHKNLAVYMVSGPSRPGPVPLTLQEALTKGVVKLHETGNVSELTIENFGAQQVFLQAGDLVKGGQQDRVLSVSLLLPPRSGPMAIGSFCVERGRWGARGSEDSAQFASADFALPSRQAKLAIRAPDLLAATPQGDRPASSPQNDLWRIVASTQQNLSASLEQSVESQLSPSSLQLALESGALEDAAASYIEALAAAGSADPNIIGYAFAINGALNSAEIYPSHGLFEKLWPKLLKASATEAIANPNQDETTAVPSGDAVLAFLKQAEGGKTAVRRLTHQDRVETRDGGQAVFFESSQASAGWVHRSYVVK